MARKRMIDPAIWEDDDVGTLSLGAFKLFVALISNADDEGRLEYTCRRLRGIAFRFDYSITPDDVENYLGEILDNLRSVTTYTRNGKQYIALLKWLTYQSISHPTASKLPPPLPEDSRNAPRVIPETSRSTTSQSSIDKNSIDKNKTPPAIAGTNTVDGESAETAEPAPPGGGDGGKKECREYLLFLCNGGRVDDVGWQSLEDMMTEHGTEHTLEALKTAGNNGVRGQRVLAYIAKVLSKRQDKQSRWMMGWSV